MPLIPVGRLTVATPETMAASIRAGGAAAKAVDERVQAVAVDIIAADPTLGQAAADKVSAELVAAGVKKEALLSAGNQYDAALTENLFVDPSAEHAPGALVKHLGADVVTVVQSAEWANTGTKSWKVTTGSQQNQYVRPAAPSPIGPGQLAVVAAVIRNAVAAQRAFAMRIQFLDAGGATVSTTVDTVAGRVDASATGTIMASAVAPAGAASFRALFARRRDTTIGDQGETTDVFYLDDIYHGVQSGLAVLPVLPFDGDQPGVFWDGVPGASKSVRVGAQPTPEQIAAASDAMTKSRTDVGAAWGDSLTEQDWTAFIEAAMGTDWYNGGKSGETSGAIAFRQGGVTLKTTAEVTVPATLDPVNVPVQASTFPFNYTNTPTMPGQLAGITGTFSRVSGSHATGAMTVAFTRSFAGTASVVPAGSTLRSVEGAAYRDRVQTFWVGRNDVAFTDPTHATGCLAAVQAMVDYLTPVVKRFLVLSVTTTISEGNTATGGSLASRERVLAVNTILKEAFPAQYIDVRRHIIDNGLALAGITPTQADLDAVAADTIPPSLTTDGTHFTLACRELVIAPFIIAELRARGWV